MDKQKLIDKAVEQYKGVFPTFSNKLITTSSNWTGDWSCAGYILPDAKHIIKGSHAWEVFCTQEEFEQRAKELGWVSGYLWGKEYPTNGKKPDLPDGVEIRIVGYSGQFLTVSFPGEVQHDYVNWDKSKYFIITDLRYKPKQPESHSKPSVDNSWHEKGELPPVGSVCEYDFPNPDVSWQKVEVNYISGMNAILTLETGEERHTDNFGPKHFRPFKPEREKFVEAAERITDTTVADNIFGVLFDAGCRFVSQESIR